MYYNNKRLALQIFWVVLGAALLGLSVAGVLDSSLYAGMGGGLVAVGALQIARTVKYRRDSAYREKVDTELNDERNSFLRMKSWSWTGYILVLVEGIGAVAALVMGRQELQLLFSYTVCLIIGVYWVVYMVLSRKY